MHTIKQVPKVKQVIFCLQKYPCRRHLNLYDFINFFSWTINSTINNKTLCLYDSKTCRDRRVYVRTRLPSTTPGPAIWYPQINACVFHLTRQINRKCCFNCSLWLELYANDLFDNWRNGSQALSVAWGIETSSVPHVCLHTHTRCSWVDG